MIFIYNHIDMGGRPPQRTGAKPVRLNINYNPRRSIYLLERPLAELPQTQLPTNEQVLRRSHIIIKTSKIQIY